MDIEQFLKHMNFSVPAFAKRLGVSRMTMNRYANKTTRPLYHLAREIVEYTNGLIPYEELGWMEKGKKIIPWTKKELRDNQKVNDKSNIYIDGATHTLEPIAPERK